MSKRSTWLTAIFVGLMAGSVSAQPRPGAFTTVVTTDQSVTSACIGANTINAPSSCTGGLQAGPVVVNQAVTLPSFTPSSTTNKLYNVGGNIFWNGLALATGGSVGPGTAGTIPIFTGAAAIGNSIITSAGTVITIAGTLVSNVFGANSFSAGAAGDESMTVRNTSAGVANRGVLFVGNDTSATAGTLAAHASTFTTSGAAIANGVKLTASGVGGLSLQASDATGIVHFFTGTGTVERGQITAAGLWNWTTFGAHLFAASGTGVNSLTVNNPTAGVGNAGRVSATSDTVTSVFDSYSSTWTTAGAQVQAGTMLSGNGTGGVSIAAFAAAGAVRIYTGSATLRATFDSAGNFNLGSTNIMDSPAVPTIVSGFGGAGAAIVGRNTAFKVTVGAGGTTSFAIVNFNTTFTNAPICVVQKDSNTATATRYTTNPSTTQFIVGFTPELVNGDSVFVLCRGY